MVAAVAAGLLTGPAISAFAFTADHQGIRNCEASTALLRARVLDRVNAEALEEVSRLKAGKPPRDEAGQREGARRRVIELEHRLGSSLRLSDELHQVADGLPPVAGGLHQVTGGNTATADGAGAPPKLAATGGVEERAVALLGGAAVAMIGVGGLLVPLHRRG
ncbi:hypothetical protein ACH429_08280 [Streptomyces pathocidini]|uniref:Uncharacterized protein n=1 Tax=Streptomyces pathocidini TaxID=1650571 RepID=A0ABW7UN87_9ACTN|nr:hypothetical protein [Streptomyces pathocidini]